MTHKVCPVVLRSDGGALQILAFHHPLAGRQLIKGTIEAGESVEAAAVREFHEESGIAAARIVRHLGTWASGFEGQVWAFVECAVDETLPDAWVHDAPDDGGHAFRFFWHPLGAPTDPEEWHSVYRDALQFLHARLA